MPLFLLVDCFHDIAVNYSVGRRLSLKCSRQVHYARSLGAFHGWSNENWAEFGSFFAPIVTGKMLNGSVGDSNPGFYPWLGFYVLDP